MARQVPPLPENPSLPRRVLVGLQAIAVALDEPGNPQAGATINNCFELERYQELAEQLRATPDGRRLLEERPSLDRADLDLDALRALPEGTLGRAFAAIYDLENVEPFETDQPIRNDVEYLSKRYRETHDLYHVVTGYGTDLIGEMELQAFVRGNLRLRSPRVILPIGVGIGLLRIRYLEGKVDPTPFRAREWRRRIAAARRLGEQAPPLLGFWFEDHWETPLSEVRRQLLGEPAAAVAA